MALLPHSPFLFSAVFPRLDAGIHGCGHRRGGCAHSRRARRAPLVPDGGRADARRPRAGRARALSSAADRKRLLEGGSRSGAHRALRALRRELPLLPAVPYEFQPADVQRGERRCLGALPLARAGVLSARAPRGRTRARLCALAAVLGVRARVARATARVRRAPCLAAAPRCARARARRLLPRRTALHLRRQPRLADSRRLGERGRHARRFPQRGDPRQLAGGAPRLRAPAPHARLQRARFHRRRHPRARGAARWDGACERRPRRLPAPHGGGACQ